jgi:hypothetical protein
MESLCRVKKETACSSNPGSKTRWVGKGYEVTITRQTQALNSVCVWGGGVGVTQTASAWQASTEGESHFVFPPSWRVTS